MRSSSKHARNLSLWIGLGILVVVFALSLWANVAPPFDPYDSVGGRLEAPNAVHWFGTDNIGRDVFTRVMQSGLLGLGTSASAAVSAEIIGVVIAAVAISGGRAVQELIMRFADAFLAIPGILIVLLLRVVLGAGTVQLIIAMVVLYVPSVIRVARGAMIEVNTSDFVVLARQQGVSRARIMFLYLIPNAYPTLLVQVANIASRIIVLEAALSYLGQGIQPPVPSAGRMLYENQVYMQPAPFLLVAPALIIFALATGWNLLADGLQRKLAV